MDYFKNCQIKYYNNFDQFTEIKKNNRIILFTTKTTNQFYKFNYKKGDTLLFGSESKGVSQTVHNIVQNKVNIPIKKDTRSLNLASSVAIAASEALRQINLY